MFTVSLGLYVSVISALFGYLGVSTALSAVFTGIGDFTLGFLMGVLGLTVLAFGLAGAIMALKRADSRLLAIGESLGMLEGYIVNSALGSTAPNAWASAVAFGILIFFPSFLGLVFAALS